MDKVTLKYFGLNDTLSSGPTELSFRVPNAYEPYDTDIIDYGHRVVVVSGGGCTELHWFHQDYYEGEDYLVHIELAWWGPTTFGSPLYNAYKMSDVTADSLDEAIEALIESSTAYHRTFFAALNLITTGDFTDDSQFCMLVEALDMPEPLKRFGYQVTLSYNNAHPLVFNCESTKEGYDYFKAALDSGDYATILNDCLYNPLTAGTTLIDNYGRCTLKVCATGDKGVPRWCSSYGYVKFTYINDSNPTWTLAPDGIQYEEEDVVAYGDILPGATGVCAFIEEVELSSTTTIISGGAGALNINDDKYIEVQRRYLDG